MAETNQNLVSSISAYGIISDAPRVSELLHAAARVKSVDEFKNWIRKEVRRVLPHGALACGHGRLNAAGVSMDYVVTVDYPVEHLAAICNSAGGIDTPVMRRWFQCRTPVIFEADEPWSEVAPEWLAHFRQHKLINVLAHAEYDTARCVGTYFSFHRLSPPLGHTQQAILADIMPVLHETLLRVIGVLEAHGRPSLQVLSPRERQIAGWIGEGKSNSEIAKCLFLSENTIKHHVTAILQKAGVENRAALAAFVATSASEKASNRTTVF